MAEFLGCSGPTAGAVTAPLPLHSDPAEPRIARCTDPAELRRRAEQRFTVAEVLPRRHLLLLSPCDCLLVNDAPLRLHARPLYGQAECVAVRVLGELDVFFVPAAANSVYECLCVERARAGRRPSKLCVLQVWESCVRRTAAPGDLNCREECKCTQTAASC
jgi:hypothetical protein